MSSSMMDDLGHESAGEDAATRKKRKRNRAVLSCTNCKARKIKCSRQIPCEACLKRDVAASCRWADPAIQPPPQVFALDGVVESIRSNLEARLSHLEGMMKVIPTQYSDAAAKKALAESYSGALNSDLYSIHDGSLSPPAAEQGDEAEHAAFALEVLAGGDFVNPLAADTKPTKASLDNFSIDVFTYESIMRPEEPLDPGNFARIPLLTPPNRRAHVETILSYLGTFQTADAIVEGYFNTVGWINGAIFPPMLKKEHRAFWHRAQNGDRDFDPAWLALYCMVFAQAILFPFNELRTDHLSAEDFFEMSRSCLECADWRRKPCLRVVQTLFVMVMHLLGRNELGMAYIFKSEAARCAMALGLHKLGSDPSTMPREDRSVPSGSLLARELVCTIWWDVIVQDWMAASIGDAYSISPRAFDTSPPRNFNYDTILESKWDAQPEPISVFTDTTIQYGKAVTAKFVRGMCDLGPLPSGGPALDTYYAALLKLDQGFMDQLTSSVGPTGAWRQMKDDWRLCVGTSGMNTRRLRLHRPLMTRGYRDKKFERSTRICVETSQTILGVVRKLTEMDAPVSALWFLHRHAMTAILALFIDILHDADTGVPDEISDRKLVDLPYVLNCFMQSEASKFPQTREMGRKGKLLIHALNDAVQARRIAKGSGNAEDYGKVLRRVASDVKDGATPSPTVSTTNPTSANTTPQTGWFYDDSTRNLLASLGLLNTTSAPLPLMSTDVIGQPVLDTNFLSNDFYASMQSQTMPSITLQADNGFDFLDTTFWDSITKDQG